VKLFRREIPGALPLLKYFYDNLSEDWLPFLEKEGLLGEPLPDDQLADVSRLRAWPAGQYLVRMASSTNEETRTIVARALRAVGSSTHSDVKHAGLDAVAASFGRGAGGMPFAHAERVRGLVLALYHQALRFPAREDESRYDRKHRYFAAYGTLRGAAVDLCMQFIFWQSKDNESVIGRAERETIANSPDLRGVFEAELEDQSPAGWIPRAVLGAI